MRIAFVASRLVYPPDGGTPLRNYHLVRLAAARHEVCAFAFADATRTAGALTNAGVRLQLVPPPPPRSTQERLRALFFGREPDLAMRFRSPALLDGIQRFLPAFAPHLVQVQSLDMAFVVPFLRQLLPGCPIVLDEHNAEYLLQWRAARLDAYRPIAWHRAFYSLLQYRRLARYEAVVCSACQLVLAVSEEDRAALQAVAPRTPIAVVPNGIALQDYEDVRPYEAMASGVHFVFTGKMDFRPNVDAVLWFAHKVWPSLSQLLPHARFWIVGRDPVPAIRALARRPRVCVTGAVQDARPYIAGATVFVAPLRMGGGTRLKLLEAAALRRPIVATPAACEGLPMRPGQDCLVARTADEFIRACHALVDDPGLAAQLGESAYQHVAVPLEWSALLPRLEAAYAQALGR